MPDSGKSISKWLIVGAALLGLLAGLLMFDFTTSEVEAPVAMKAHPIPSTEVRSPPSKIDNAEPLQDSAPATSDVSTDDDFGNDIAPLRATTAGELVVDEHTRLTIEALIAQNEPNELQSAVREQTENLAPTAARRAEELVDQFVIYQRAQRQAYPPGTVPFTEDDAVRQLEGLRALREMYFGADVARQFFGKEEAISREMIELMRIENDPGLSAQEKLERAQAVRQRLPSVTAIEKANREDAVKRN